MKSLVEFINESKNVSIKTTEDLYKFLDKFDNNATSWRNATDEIPDIARTAREFLAELDHIILEPIEFKTLKSPAEWNTQGKQFITTAIEKMSKSTVKRFLDYLNEMF